MDFVSGVVGFLVGCELLILGWMYYARRVRILSSEKQTVERLLVAASQLKQELPLGCRVYFDAPMHRKCRACSSGSLQRRKRFWVTLNNEGARILVETTGIFWCDKCNRRGLFQRQQA